MMIQVQITMVMMLRVVLHVSVLLIILIAHLIVLNLIVMMQTQWITVVFVMMLIGTIVRLAY